MKIQEVIDKINTHKKECDMFHEYTEANQIILSEHLGTFEAILSEQDGKKYLVPEHGLLLHFLYRGQNEEVIPCVPSIFRGNPTPAEIFLNRMRLIVFRRMLDSHPIVNYFFKRHGFVIDYEGLAQHYGVQTSILDLTSNLDIALFFATCKYNRGTDCYDYYDDGLLHEAILYVFDPLRENEPTPPFSLDNYLRGNITPIGLQAFPRPGVQEGYALHIPEGESLKCWMYKFTFTNDDSKYYFGKFNRGEKLWIHDRLIPITKKIANQQEFSFDVFDEAYRLYRPKGYSKTKLKKELKTLIPQVTLRPSVPDVTFSKNQQREIVAEWNNGLGEEFCQKIVRKKWFHYTRVNEETGVLEGIHDESDFMTFEHLSESVFCHLIAYPDGPDGALWRNYKNTSRPLKHIHQQGEWRKVEACMNNVFGKPWLTKEDWFI